MSNFHSTVSRREFMKALGLAGAGLGAAAAAAPVFHDLDEVISSPKGDFKHPWWVKRREFNDPTMEIDINTYVRWDRRHMYDPPYDEVDRENLAWGIDSYGYSGFPTAGKDVFELKEYGTALRDEHIRQGLPGMSLRDAALGLSVDISYSRPNYLGNTSVVTKGLRTIEQRGVPRWEGTPEENLRMLRVAGRYMGTYSLGAVEMNDFNRHFVWSNIGRAWEGHPRYIPSKPVEFGPEVIDTADRRVIPESCRYSVVQINRHAEQAMKCAPGYIGRASNRWSYFFGNVQYARMMRFLRTLGYQAYYNDMTGAQAYPTLCGLGEKGRPGLLLVPYRGALVRKMDSVLTDMPLVPEPPIDGGMTKFCYTCKKCATTCPVGAISTETEPYWEIDGPWNAAGIKNWHFSYPICGSFKSGPWAPEYCGTCLAVCPFSKFSSAPIHSVVQATAATTSLFNGFFTNMDTTFGYGKNLGAGLSHSQDEYVDDFWNTLGPEYGLLTWYGNTPPH